MSVPLIGKSQSNKGTKSKPVFADNDKMLLTLAPISAVEKDGVASIACPGQPPYVREGLRTSGGQGALKVDEPDYPIGMVVLFQRQTVEGVFDAEQRCRPFAREDRVSVKADWPAESKLWRTVCADGREATLAISVPGAVVLEGDQPALGRLVRKAFVSKGLSKLYLGVVTEYDPETKWRIKYFADDEVDDLSGDDVRALLLPLNAWRLTFADPRVAAAVDAGKSIGSISLKDAVSGPLPAGRDCMFEQVKTVSTTAARVPSALKEFDELSMLLPAHAACLIRVRRTPRPQGAALGCPEKRCCL